MSTIVLLDEPWTPSEDDDYLELDVPSYLGTFELEVDLRESQGQTGVWWSHPRNGHSLFWLFIGDAKRGGWKNTPAYITLRRPNKIRVKSVQDGEERKDEGRFIDGRFRIEVGGGVSEVISHPSLRSVAAPWEQGKYPEGPVKVWLGGQGEHEPLPDGITFKSLTFTPLGEEPTEPPPPLPPDDRVERLESRVARLENAIQKIHQATGD